MTQQLRAAFVAWARSRGHTAPPTEEGLRVLVAQFLAEAMQRGQRAEEPPQLVGADQAEHADHKINLLRDSGGMLDIADPETENSDFGEFIRQRAAAMDEADGDDLAAGIIHRGADTAKLQAQAPFQRTDAPPSAVEAVLGNVATLTWGESKQVAQWSGPDVDTRPLTVTIGVINLDWATPAGVSFGGEFRPYATLLWGSGGFSYTVEVDLAKGAQWTVGASSAFLTITLPHSTDEPAGLALKAAGSFSYQPCMRTAPITRTVYINSPPLSNNAAQVPAFAKKVTVWRSNAKAGIQIELFGQSPGDSFIVERAAAASIPETTVPDAILLQGNPATIGIANTSITETTRCMCVFELDI